VIVYTFRRLERSDNRELRWAAAGHSLARWFDFIQEFVAAINYQPGMAHPFDSPRTPKNSSVAA
jgi:hypothetical protein